MFISKTSMNNHDNCDDVYKLILSLYYNLFCITFTMNLQTSKSFKIRYKEHILGEHLKTLLRNLILLSMS